MYESRNHPLLSRSKVCRPRCSTFAACTFSGWYGLGDRRAGISLSRWVELDRFASERLHDFGRDGTGRSPPFIDSQDFRFWLCVVFGIGFHRHRIAGRRPVCAPAPAPVSHCRKMRKVRLGTAVEF